MTWPCAGPALIEGREDAAGALERIQRAEQQGVPMIWTTLGPRTPDAPTLLAAAAMSTHAIGLGTAIVPTYPRHPAVLASQVLVVNRLAPGRVRLGVGPSHRPSIERMLGIAMDRPLAHLREYVTVLRGLLWDGGVDFAGEYFTVHLTLDERAQVPIYVSSLGERAFRIAGEIADGVISWLAPVPYLRARAVPALHAGADLARRAVPRLVSHVPVVMTEDRDTMLKVARRHIAPYGRLPFYAAMFERSGYPVDQHGEVTDDLLDHLVVWGDGSAVRRRLESILGDGIDELVVTQLSGPHPTEQGDELARVVASIDPA